MNAVLQTIRILVVILLTKNICCQDGFSDQDILRVQQLAANDAQIETITSYSTNIIQRDPNSQSISSVSVQYHMTDDPEKTEDYNRSDRSRAKKVYRIKNPFQRQLDEDERSPDTKSAPTDSGTGASNQYASMQYSLPPEEFLQQMRAENQYHQQQQQLQQQQQQQQQQQLSTQTSSLSYTVTPQPQYQYSTLSASNFDIGNQQSNQIPQLEAKSLSQMYHTNTNNFQYNVPNSFGLDVSTPAPNTQFLSTPLPNNQYLATPSNTYVSSSAPMYLSSPPSLQQYVSSPLSNIQTGSSDYSNNRVTTTVGNSISYDNNDFNKKMQIDHYDNSANGIRYPIHQQFQNEYPSSTISPSTSFNDLVRESWQNSLNNGIHSASRSSPQDVSQAQFQNTRYSNNQQDMRRDSSYDNVNSDTHRIGSIPSANNVYLNFVQPDYQLLNSLKSRSREYEQETAQPAIYSHGDYGWKLPGKKSFINQEGPTQSNYPRYQLQQADNGANSQMNFHVDTSKGYNYDQISKSSSEKLDAQEFAKAAAKAHEQYKQQLEGNNYPTSNPYNQNSMSNLGQGNTFYGNNDKQRNKMYSDAVGASPYTHSSQQTDLITLSPYFYSNSRDNTLDSKTKLPFDHDKALKNIVSIDVSNVVPNSESQIRTSAPLDSNRYSISSYGKDQDEQNNKQYYKPLTDSYYKDKNAVYGFNIKTKPEEPTPDRYKQSEANLPLQNKPQSSESFYSQGTYADNKRYPDDISQSQYLSQLNHYQDNLQSSANVQQQSLSRPLNQLNPDITNVLKVNDIPFRLTQGLNADSLRLYNSNFDQSGIPTPLPVRLNQNVENHQIDVATNILSKLLANKPSGLTINRPDIESQSGNFLSNINGFKIANPYNMDLKLVADMLKGKTTIDDSNISPLRDQFNKPAPLKLDISQLQQLLLKNDNNNLGLLNSGLSAITNPFFEVYNPTGYYQGVKYSRSQEEEESIPIADASSNHPIGAVMEGEELISGDEGSTDSDTTGIDDDGISVSLSEDRPKNGYGSGFRTFADRHRHPNSLLPSRHSYQRKYPKSDVDEPYPLLKPPPRTSRSRGFHSKVDKHRRRRLNKPKILRVYKTEPLFEAESSLEEEDRPSVTTLLKPPPPIAEDKSDVEDTLEGA